MYPILTTKLYLPPSAPNAVVRSRLIDRLNSGLNGKLTLISAAAGFGKTTLVSEWAAGSHQAVAWFSLDEGDSEFSRFLSYFIAALQTIKSDVGEGVLAMLKAQQPPSNEVVLTTLLNDIAMIPQPFVLVLDDYHLIDDRSIDEAISFMLSHMPPSMHLLITTREDPPLSLAKLRARGQLSEIRIVDLRFTANEAAQFLNHSMGLNLSEENIAALEARTEGWITGLQLAAISMRGHSDTSQFIVSFTGNHQFVVDYLLEEILQQQPHAIQQFLLSTSILDRLCGSLCEAVLDSDCNGQQTLEQLQQANLFVVPLDEKRHWYRFHHLFADVLQARLKQQSNELSTLHQRASQWYEQNDQLSDAIKHAFLAEDLSRVAQLAEKAWPVIYRSDFRNSMFLGWLKALPEEIVTIRPVLSMGYAWSLLDFGEFEAADVKLNRVEHWLNNSQTEAREMVVEDETIFCSLPAIVAVARSYMALANGDVAGTIKLTNQALMLLPESDHLQRGTTIAMQGLAYLYIGELDAAGKALTEGMRSLHMAGNTQFAISITVGLADIRIIQGRLYEALCSYEHALALATMPNNVQLQGVADQYLGLCEAYRQRGDLSTAKQQLAESEVLGEAAGLPDWPYRYHITQARIKQSLGEFDDALMLFNQAEQLYCRSPLPDLRPVAALRARLWLLQGKLSDALVWVKKKKLSIDDELSFLCEFEHITLVRVFIAQYKTSSLDAHLNQAINLTERLLKEAEEGGRQASVIELFILQAVAYQLKEDMSTALQSLLQALELAQPEAYVGLFIDEGLPIAKLLSRVVTHGIISEYVHLLLRSFETKEEPQKVSANILSSDALIEQLSQRELKVLQLVAQGLSNRDIGERLFLAIDTVKGHNRRIFAKLAVKRRTEAVAKAKQLNII